MHKKRNRRRGQPSAESHSNMSVVTDHSSAAGIGTETRTVVGNLDHKDYAGNQSVRSKSNACNCDHHGHDPRVLKAKVKAAPVLHNGCKDAKCSDNHRHNHHHVDSAATSTVHSNLEMNSDHLQTKNNVGNQAADQKRYANKSTSMQNRSDNPKDNSDTKITSSEPISELTKLVENIDIRNEFASRGAAHDATDLPSALIRANEDGIDDDEMLAEFGADGPSSSSDFKYPALLDHDEELPSSLSDFVLGYRNESYPITSVPPNDDDIDVINVEGSEQNITLVPYESELQMPDIMRLITKDLSEPYSIYTYRYFIHNWPQLCFLACIHVVNQSRLNGNKNRLSILKGNKAMYGPTCVGAIVCKLDVHKKMARRGYIAMLAVDENHRKQKIGSSLVRKAIRAMVRGDCDEVVLETEITNKPALRLYENLGFVRDKRLFRYYLNGVDALRLKLWLR